LDDLSTGHRSLVLGHGFVQARAGDQKTVRKLFQQEKFDAVMHFAAKSLVAESVEKPDLYHENNVEQTRLLLETMLEAGVHDFIFSSTCAVFGDVSVARIHENLPKKPKNPYGQTKLEVEHMLEAMAAKGLRSIALRYFNAAGAEPLRRVGEWHEPETHLIPRVLRNTALGRPAEIFGLDYPTQDGTCVRDYIHVWDLAAAHEAALKRILAAKETGLDKGRFEAFNLGSENGFSVHEVIRECERAIGLAIKRLDRARRAGDPPELVANSTLAKKTLGFQPRHSSLAEIVGSAWDWEKKRARQENGRAAVFVDRDGTINWDPGYLADPEKLELLPGAGEALAQLQAAGFSIIVVSNQSGVGRGLIAEDALKRVHAKLDLLLAAQGARIDRYELCIHHPEDDCDCRKPKPKLILSAADALGINVGKSYMIGDKTSDIQAGIRAGCKGSILVRTGEGDHSDATGAAFDADSLPAAAKWILSRPS
jgi:UDP-glucose 4-epimerase